MPRRRAGSPVQVSPGAEDGELDAGDVQQLGERPGDLLRPVLERAGAADPEQVLDVGSSLARPARPGGPRRPSVLASTPRGSRSDRPHGLPLFSRLRSIDAGLGRERRLDQHLVAAHVEDVVDVLDVDRALLDAGAAGGARPQHVGVDDAALLGGRRPAAAAPAPTPEPSMRGEAGLGHVVAVPRRPRRTARRRRALVRHRLPPMRYGAFANRWSRRSMITQLGRQRLVGVPRRALATGSGRTRCRSRSRACPSR